jgi:ribosomal-protein-alanine N-acetyltransferase
MTRIKPNNFLESERLVFRPLTESDVKGAYAGWLNDPDVCRGNSHATFPATKAALLAYVHQANTSRSQVVLAIILRSRGNHIGNISLQDINWLNRTADLAVLVGSKDSWGRGYGEEAVGAMLRYGFKRLGLRRITCGTFGTNTGMRRLAVKMGFRQEGVRRAAVYKDGGYLDIVEYGLLKEEFDPSGVKTARPRSCVVKKKAKR